MPFEALETRVAAANVLPFHRRFDLRQQAAILANFQSLGPRAGAIAANGKRRAQRFCHIRWGHLDHGVSWHDIREELVDG